MLIYSFTTNISSRADIFARLGLRANPLSAPPVPSYAPHFIIFNFVLAHAVLSTRGIKIRMGIDHNVNPREDATVHGPAAVKAGKITQKQLDTLNRREAAHANAIENLPFFVGAMVMATVAKLDPGMVNRYAIFYTAVRIAYAVAYAQIEDKNASYARSVLWWAGNITCVRLFWFAGKSINGYL